MRASAIILAILYSILVGAESAQEENKIMSYNFQHPRAFRIIHERKKQDNEGDAGFKSFIPSSTSSDLVTPWWEGPNVCEETKNVEESQLNSTETSGENGFDLQSTHCTTSESSYVCTKKMQTNGMQKTVVVTRQCCHGYMRPDDDRPGCIDDAAFITRSSTTTIRGATTLKGDTMPVLRAGIKFSMQEQNVNILNRSKRDVNVYNLLPSGVTIRLPSGNTNRNNPPSTYTIRRAIFENSGLPVGIPTSALMLSNTSRYGTSVAINYRYDNRDYVGSRYVSFYSG